ncbi:hypothetical protein N7462_003667 [Penicillium macrosclerotiorum]|uniref:uncharacterized protein n=1 Tax=Penicillium macrosclerotiorum TaxID=303699 RepID=UPI0025485B66|nr:uncharacterized protein N7462_003667 [Penicillium macrosclerotiorum]KAJ5689275.1 hypothetical protein N7462_003667 [Penicillium macrosclerotiorum]
MPGPSTLGRQMTFAGPMTLKCNDGGSGRVLGNIGDFDLRNVIFAGSVEDEIIGVDCGSEKALALPVSITSGGAMKSTIFLR